MAAAYFIVLDRPSIDAFVNGKAMARESRRLSRLAKTIGIKSLDDFVSVDHDEATALVDEFGLEDAVAIENEQWFSAEEGLAWVTSMRNHIQTKPKAVKNADAVLSDLAEYASVLEKAKKAGVRWHLSIDY